MNGAVKLPKLGMPMGLTDLTVRLMLIFFPGIICFFIVDALTVHRERKTHEILLLGYVYGVLSYFIYGLLLVPLGMMFSLGKRGAFLRPWELSVFQWLSDPKAQLDFWEIVSATALAFVLAFLITWCDRRKFLHAIAHRLKVTNKFSELDVWNFAFNLDRAHWCVVRDMSHELVFQGYIRAFSDVGDCAELLLTEVMVFDQKTNELCYQADRIYLARKKDDLTIEFQDLPQGEEVSNGGEHEQAGTETRLADSSLAGRNGEKGRSEPAQHHSHAAPKAGRNVSAKRRRRRR